MLCFRINAATSVATSARPHSSHRRPPDRIIFSIVHAANTSGWFAHEEPELEVATSVEGEETDLDLMGAINDNDNEALVFAEKKDKKEKDDKKKKKDKEKKKDKDDVRDNCVLIW